MIEGSKYIETVKSYFSFLITEFDFEFLLEKVRGNAFYDIQYKDKTRIVSISYENIEDYLLIIIFLLQNGKKPNYDDKTKTLHLNRLNAVILSSIDKAEMIANNEWFSTFRPSDKLEKNLLKSAKELRLCLKHFDRVK